MKALQFDRKVLRYAAAAVAGRVMPGRGATWGPLELADVDAPSLPGEGWRRLRPRLSGICGSDLATIDGASSRYFEPIVSFPFVPGHEVVADTDDNRRVVLEPVLGCVSRGIDPPCPACTRGDLGNCERIAYGCLEPGLQSGFCTETGGGWGTFMVGHDVQLHVVPDETSDEDAVMVEPAACAVHAAFAARACGAEGAIVAVIGAGSVGLLVTSALRRYASPSTIAVAAKHPHQQRLARELGADHVCEPHELARLARRLTGSLANAAQLTGGVDCVLDCVADDDSLALSLSIVRPRGTVLVVGMPNNVRLNLTTLWHRETRLAGVYAYGTETLADGSRRRTFDLAFDLVREQHLGRLVSAAYPLSRYRDAIEHAAGAGRRGAVKVAFDLRDEKERYR